MSLRSDILHRCAKNKEGDTHFTGVTLHILATSTSSSICNISGPGRTCIPRAVNVAWNIATVIVVIIV